MIHLTRNKALKFLFRGELVALCAFVVYLFTLAPGVYGFDSAELATGAYTLGIVHPPGFPLYMLIGKVFTFLPFGSVAYRLNLMSAFFAALTVYLLYKVVRRISGKDWVSWVSSAFLGFSIYFWQMSVVAEVYTLHTFFLALEVLILLWWRESGGYGRLALFAFIYGLSLANHTTGLLFAPGMAWLVFSSAKWRWKPSAWWLGWSACFLAALLVYAYIPLRASSVTPLNYLEKYYAIDATTLSGLFWVVSGAAYRFFAFGYPPAEIFGELISGIRLVWQNFLGVGFLLGMLGLLTAFKKDWKLAAGFLLIFLGNFIFYVNYRVLDKDTMFLPSFVIFTIFIGHGLSTVDELIYRFFTETGLRGWIQRVQPVFWVVLAVLLLPLNWRWADMSQALGHETYSNMVLNSVQKNSTIIASWSPAVVLEYYQIVEGRRPDLHVYNRSRSEVARYYKYWSLGLSHSEISALINEEELAAINQLYQNTLVYSIEYDPVIAGSYEYLPVGTYYRLVKQNNQ